MSWQETFATRFGPGALCGLRLGDWLRLLWANRFSVDPAYWPRAAMVTAASLQNSAFAVWEHWRYDAAIRATTPQPPLFILGIWRSGTTHLHNLLARDRRFAYPDFFEVFYPHTFLSTGWLNRRILAKFLPQRRPQDNVRMAIGEPQEDEFALNCLTQMSWVLLWTFPRGAEHYERFLTLRQASPEEVARWQSALKWFVQKLTYCHRRPLVLKSPAHTGQIKLLLEAFPDARFIHIHRNPYNVFQSSLHSARTAIPWWTLQRPDHAGLEERTLDQYEEIYDSYFDERRLIPAGRLHELQYEALVADPVGQLRATYEALQLPDFAVAEPAIGEYLASIRGYETNRFGRIEPPWKEAVARRWRQCFDEWGYAT
ncbi:MAG: sulfotransferase [Planctomycetaceae bacterium]|nr:sulfotransferase [Planctomycetaceae bacterium]